MKIELDSPTRTSLEQIARNMNPRDADEIMASGGFTPIQGLLGALVVSSEVQIARIGGTAVAAFGIAPIVHEHAASPWMLATPDLYRLRKQFMTISRAVVARWRSSYPLLYNFIDARNTPSIKWLAALGFTLRETVPEYGIARVPFIRFEMNTPCVSPQ